MALNGATLEQQLTVHNARTKCQPTSVTNKNEKNLLKFVLSRNRLKQQTLEKSAG